VRQLAGGDETGGLAKVECYSGHTYAQEPRAFVLAGERYSVAAVERAWQEPDGRHFRVITTEGYRFELIYASRPDIWLAYRIT
jgi:hypothetical protein